jgi:hypothetical protein
MSIKLKVILVLLVSLAVIGAGNVWLARGIYEQDMKFVAQQAVRGAGEAYTGLEKGDVEKLGATLEALATNPLLLEPFQKRDRARLQSAAAPLFETLKKSYSVTHWYFLEPEPARTCFLRVHRPDLFGDTVNRVTLANAVRTHAIASGKELGKTAFALRVVRPWTVGGKLLGYMELGEEIDSFLSRMKAQTGDDFALLVEKQHLDAREWAATRGGKRNNWDDRPGLVVVDSTFPDESVLDFAESAEAIPDEGRVLRPFEQGDRAFIRGLVPVRDAAGRKVGGLVVLQDVTALRASTKSERDGILILILFMAVGASAVLIVLLDRLVFFRLDRMIGQTEDLSARLVGGDYEAGAGLKASEARDEIGKFETFFARFVGVVGGQLKELSDRLRASERRGRDR